MWSKIWPTLITAVVVIVTLAVFLRIPGVAAAILPNAASPATGKKLLTVA